MLTWNKHSIQKTGNSVVETFWPYPAICIYNKQNPRNNVTTDKINVSSTLSSLSTAEHIARKLSSGTPQAANMPSSSCLWLTCHKDSTIDHSQYCWHIPVYTTACPYVCLSVHSHLENHMSKFHKLLCTLPVCMTQSSSDDSETSYYIPVLWTTACFHRMEPMD